MTDKGFRVTMWNDDYYKGQLDFDIYEDAENKYNTLLLSFDNVILEKIMESKVLLASKHEKGVLMPEEKKTWKEMDKEEMEEYCEKKGYSFSISSKNSYFITSGSLADWFILGREEDGC